MNWDPLSVTTDWGTPNLA
ncbi:hypothetical protein A2U01_0115519, partial [Trifolium medium]|nr:hypothetical protein [Trifolium medium]